MHRKGREKTGETSARPRTRSRVGARARRFCRARSQSPGGEWPSILRTKPWRPASLGTGTRSASRASQWTSRWLDLHPGKQCHREGRENPDQGGQTAGTLSGWRLGADPSRSNSINRPVRCPDFSRFEPPHSGGGLLTQDCLQLHSPTRELRMETRGTTMASAREGTERSVGVENPRQFWMQRTSQEGLAGTCAP